MENFGLSVCFALIFALGHFNNWMCRLLDRDGIRDDSAIFRVWGFLFSIIFAALMASLIYRHLKP